MSQYLEAAERVLKAAKIKNQTYKGPCDQCAHYKRGMWPLCEHPIVKLVAFNQTKAFDARLIQECAQQRDKSSVYGDVVCGPDGALFEPA